LTYCKRGFEVFFDNPSHSISTQALIDIMLEDKLKEEHVKAFVAFADADGGGTVDYTELFVVFLT